MIWAFEGMYTHLEASNAAAFDATDFLSAGQFWHPTAGQLLASFSAVA
jgi:hypothetical protein